MARELLNMADAIDQQDDSVFRFGRSSSLDSQQISLSRLAQQAEGEYRARRDREVDMPSNLLGEPAWDILLDLFVEHTQGRVTPIKSACIASCAPTTTALRYLSLLESKDLIETKQEHSDKRVRLIGLTSKAIDMMQSYLRRRS